MLLKINNQKTRIQKGFMMTEVLITALLIVIAMVGILPILFSGMKTSKTTKLRATMTSIAQKEIETFNQSKFTNVLDTIKKDLVTAADYNTFINTNETLTTTIEPNVSLMPYLVYIDPVNGEIKNSLEPGLKKVNVNRTYRFIKGEITVSDDIIQLIVTAKIDGSTGKPVTLTSLLSRDKL